MKAVALSREIVPNGANACVSVSLGSITQVSDDANRARIFRLCFSLPSNRNEYSG